MYSGGRTEVYNCVFEGNRSGSAGGGSYGADLHNCILKGNLALTGGGIFGGMNEYCAIINNRATEGAGGADSSYLAGCTLTGNSGLSCGGAYGGRLDNCIVYFNKADRGDTANYVSATIYTSCTTPLPTNTVGNISADPQLVDAFHLSSSSPCRGIGNPVFIRGKDIDNDPWQDPPPLGCDEYNPGPITSALSVAIGASYTNVAVGFPVDFTSSTDGHASASVWNFGDGSSATNCPYITHAWKAAGDYSVALTAYNESHPDGVTATVLVRVEAAPVHFVIAGSTNPVPPFATWETAASDIQSAIDVATLPGARVLVGDGLYNTGGRALVGIMTNRVAVNKPLVVSSLNGPARTIIQGYALPGSLTGDENIRCVYLAGNAVLAGLTLTNGASRSSYLAHPEYERKGGGIWCESMTAVVRNCVLAGNSGNLRAGGSYGGTLIHCELRGNSSSDGGGTYAAVLTDCTLTGNRANNGGAAYGGSLTRCTLTGNAAGSSGGGAALSTLQDCTLTGNSGNNGGGAASSILTNCIVSGNSAVACGGGVQAGTLNNCDIAGNSAQIGGGSYQATLYNCIVYFNAASVSGTNYDQGTLNYCCTTPLPPGGTGNFTNAPLFADLASGNLHLQSSSPCINAGLNSYAASSTDLDGNPRIAGGTVDIGAYEFQSPASLICHAWLQRYGMPTDGSADKTDSDSDGMTNWQEWIADTDPTNAASALRLLMPTPAAAPPLTISWQSSSNRIYSIERALDLSSDPAFTCVASNLTGSFSTMSFTDTNAPAANHGLYRVRVEFP